VKIRTVTSAFVLFDLILSSCGKEDEADVMKRSAPTAPTINSYAVGVKGAKLVATFSKARTELAKGYEHWNFG
jgi:hypothetical protein